MLTTTEAADRLGITTRSVARLIRSGALAATWNAYARRMELDEAEITRYQMKRRKAGRPKTMNYEIKITENVQTWQRINGASVAVSGTKVEVIVPAYSGYTTIYDRVARSDAEYKEAMAEAHREGANWKQHGLR